MWFEKRWEKGPAWRPIRQGRAPRRLDNVMSGRGAVPEVDHSVGEPLLVHELEMDA